jgi:hypothetical protein
MESIRVWQPAGNYSATSIGHVDWQEEEADRYDDCFWLLHEALSQRTDGAFWWHAAGSRTVAQQTRCVRGMATAGACRQRQTSGSKGKSVAADGSSERQMEMAVLAVQAALKGRAAAERVLQVFWGAEFDRLGRVCAEAV